MSVVETSLGPHSVKFAFSADPDFPANLALAVKPWIEAHGWTYYDTEHNSANWYAYVFRNLCKDGVTYKYVNIDMKQWWQTQYRHNIYVRVYESWDNVTHVGTNPAWGSTGSVGYSQYMKVDGAVNVFVFADDRYLFVIQEQGDGSTVGSGQYWAPDLYGGATGIIEISRDTEGDDADAGIPPYALFDTSGPTLDSMQATFPISFPKCADGTVGIGATDYNFMSFERGFAGLRASGIPRISFHEYMKDPPLVNAWTGKFNAWDMICGKVYSAGWDVRGHLYGIHYLPPGIGVRNPGVDSINLKINSDGFLDESGNLTAHWILPGFVNHRFAIPK